MKGLGLSAVRERIRKSFLEVHSDQRTREQRQDDEEMLASVQMDPAQAPQVEAEVHSLIEQSNILKKNAMEQRANAYIGAALRSPQVPKQTAHHRSNVHLGWEIEAPTESADALIHQALRQLKRK
jgi:hypothetical protein